MADAKTEEPIYDLPDDLPNNSPILIRQNNVQSYATNNTFESKIHYVISLIKNITKFINA